MRGRVALVPVLALATLAARPAAAAFTERVSVGLGGAQSNGGGSALAVSSDGQLVAFYGLGATNLPGGTSGTFIRDRGAATTTFVSSYGMEAFTPALATAAFTTRDVLVPGDTNNAVDAFVLDVASDTVERVSVGSGGSQAASGGDSPSLSSDGSLVAFRSGSADLVATDTNGAVDVFVHDRTSGVTERVSVASDGSQADGPSDLPAISADGRFVAFVSRATNLVAPPTDGQRYIFVHDRMTGATELASILPDDSRGSQTCSVCVDRPALSGDGSIVAFVASPDQVYARDRGAGTTELVSRTPGGMPGNGVANRPAVSADGSTVAFESFASDLVAGDSNGAVDVFVRDRLLGTTERADVATGGSQGGEGNGAVVSGDGRVIGFSSEADDLVPGDTNARDDAFVRDRTCGNGMVEGAEECDDGRNDDGDGCDANCTITRCGNGRRSAGEGCDDGATNGADACCSAACTPVDADGDGVCDAVDPCTGSAIVGGRLLLTGVSHLFMRTPRLAMKGHMTLPVPFSPALDPLANGIRLLLTDALGRPALDRTIPGGAFGGSPGVGWTVNATRTKWRYKNADPAPFPGAITRIQVQDQSASAPGRVRFTIRGELSLDAYPEAVPVQVFLFLHPPDDASGQCGDARNACTVTSMGDRIDCR